MILRTALGLIVFAIGVAYLPRPSEGASTSPGKLAVYASTSAAVIDDPTIILSGTIQKGKKKRVVEVFVSATAPAGGVESGLLQAVPIVNGLEIMEPTNGGVTVRSSYACQAPWRPCQTVSEFWLDLDAAEAAHPGQFIGMPLVIEVQAEWQGDGPDAPIAVSGSLRARLEKE